MPALFCGSEFFIFLTVSQRETNISNWGDITATCNWTYRSCRIHSQDTREIECVIDIWKHTRLLKAVVCMYVCSMYISSVYVRNIYVMCMYVCLYVCMYLCSYFCMHTCLYAVFLYTRVLKLRMQTTLWAGRRRKSRGRYGKTLRKEMTEHRWERWRRIRWSGNLQLVLLCRHQTSTLKYFINVFPSEINSVAPVLFVFRRSRWKAKSLPMPDQKQSTVITQRTGVMNCPLTDADFRGKVSLRFIKINWKHPGALFIIYNSFDPTQNGCFCVRVFKPPPLFHTHSNTINQTHISLRGGFPPPPSPLPPHISN